MSLRKLNAVGLAIALTSLAAPDARAQGPGPRGPRYDPKTEVTVTGTVEKVTEHAGKGGGCCTGRHVSLRTAEGTLDVHLGPSDYWEKHGFELAAGDQIQVTGSKIEVDGSPVLLAREVRKGDKTVALRDAQGIPAWSRGRRNS